MTTSEIIVGISSVCHKLEISIDIMTLSILKHPTIVNSLRYEVIVNWSAEYYQTSHLLAYISLKTPRAQCPHVITHNSIGAVCYKGKTYLSLEF